VKRSRRDHPTVFEERQGRMSAPQTMTYEAADRVARITWTARGAATA
jgi:hypothetical protein